MITIYAYRQSKRIKEILANLGFEHNQSYEGDLMRIAEKFHNEGLFVMIYPPGKNSVNLLCIDDCAFHQK